MQLDEERDFACYCTQQQARALSLAAYCLLRFSRSSLRDSIDITIGEELYFKFIALCRKRSVQSMDIDAKNAIILTRLWASSNVFKIKDKQIDSLQLLLRGRLVS